MTEGNSSPPGLFSRLRRAGLSAFAALQNRGELFLVELQEEKARLVELLLWTIITAFLGMMFLIILTGIVIFLFPAGWRIYAAAGFCAAYLLAALLALLNLRALWRNTPTPFSDSVAEARKDVEWLESLE